MGKKDNIITTRSVGLNMLEIKEDFVLHEKTMSRLVFHAQMHSKGIRGQIIRQRRESKDDKWVPLPRDVTQGRVHFFKCNNGTI